MATGNPSATSSAQTLMGSPAIVPSHASHPASPPSKRDLTSWWKNFKKNPKKEEEKGGQTMLPLC
jgi:hypothetical protein